MSGAVVVGGGPVGLVAAILLKRKGFAVTLLERESELGGLMRSLPVIDGFEFDNGTRFVPRLGDASLDDDALAPRENWLEFNQLPSGSFFAGRFQKATGFLDINGCLTVPARRWRQGISKPVAATNMLKRLMNI
ncbi:FAD dependent oxidoreductase [Glycocaulis alkaliphilus]|uniref:FAD dependent oxidoreductase n=1 Tax=Glycocaulis alkaliphilus TaxID=1434191 RepID=A0A3T0EBW8_9PROT|nr:NAD(P)-binding protein [Glycocaulis alkaliphilus]AZU04727.1 FAD dependent oxidoreductase [Glycocaulis alkaliphilus]GGB68154.1 hypothetical protein GCM10007417_05000 [Glycocaulis alkaliphilus]